MSLFSIVTTSAQALYPANWVELSSVSVNADNSVTRPSSATAYGGASSTNILPANQDGYIQFTYTANASNQYFVSFAASNNSPEVYYSLYSIFVSSTGNYAVYERDVSKGTLGTLTTGDILKIAREGTNIKYYRNGTLMYTSAAGSSVQNLRAELSIYRGTAPPITCSFDSKLVVKPTFQYPDQNNTNGSISLQVEGGTAPFTYQWSSGEQTASIAGKSRGSYTVTVTDANSRTYTNTYTLNYPIAWKNPTNVTINADNTLTRTSAGAAWDAGASSLNILPANTDGWVEFTVTDPSTTYMIGLSNWDPDGNYSSIRFAIYITNVGNVAIYESGQSTGVFSSAVKGDVYRVARTGTQIIYTRNGTTLRTVSLTSRPMYLVDVSISANNGSVPQVTASIEKQIQIKTATLTYPDVNNTNGGVAISVEGAYTPATIQWSSSETADNISGKARGTYTATVTDALGRSQSRPYTLGYPVKWGDLRNVSLGTDGSLSKSVASGTFNAAGTSANRLLANQDGAIELVINRANSTQAYYIGLARYNTNATNTDLDYAFYVAAAGYVYIYESAVQRALISFKEGNILKIAREGGNINYYIDGQVVRTVATNTSYELRADCSILVGTIPKVTATFNYAPQIFYAIADGNWINSTTWSLTDGGAAATRMPSYGDIVYVSKHKVDITTGIYCKQLNIVAAGSATAVTINGSGSVLSVGEVKIHGDNNATAQQVLQVTNTGVINVQTDSGL